VTFTADTIKNVSSDEYPQMYPPGGEDYSWSVDKFKKNFRIQIHKNDQFDATFSLIGIDASIANAFRRILLAEIPTLAIETVYITNNTSVVQDEVLASRLGLIPLKGGKLGINQMTRILKDGEGTAQSVLSDYNTVVMKLDIECKWKKDGPQKLRAGITDVDELYENPNGESCHTPQHSLTKSSVSTDKQQQSTHTTSSSRSRADKINGSAVRMPSYPSTRTSSLPNYDPVNSFTSPCTATKASAAITRSFRP
jgi:DNA-directed RNA polymerase I and III subunit RPAC1